MNGNSIINFIHSLQEPVPQYVLGCIPAIATMGAAPSSGLLNKLLWIFRCLGCPFTGLFYYCNINNNPIAMSAYWLDSDQFVKKENGNENVESKIKYRPVGHYAMDIASEKEQEENVVKLLRECIAESSVLDRLSSLASAYYIFVGILIGITKAINAGQCTGSDWPYLPLLLAWTLPAIYKRVFGGKMVVNDPSVILRGGGNTKELVVRVKELQYNKKSAQDARVIITLVLFSMIIPWITVLLAYFTRPVGYGCRSKYITVLCSIWSLNSFVAYVSHISGEKFVSGNRFMNGWFCLCGVIIAILIIILGLLSHTQSWWIDLFGNVCKINCDNV
ncbi:hypothetical protein C1645_815009 [Glomus cerebriforme]|uniref:Uncharacterized protein n=1 Tax=Glomus cerebriforme TaxID=658196 RepID=A0A397TEM0_9GLOM|nr:hypothetical protein C1645_815009 [Glomus cerebriforme]